MEFYKIVAANIADYLDNGIDGWDLDQGTIRITARTSRSITLSLFANDANGEITEIELEQATVQTVAERELIRASD